MALIPSGGGSLSCHLNAMSPHMHDEDQIRLHWFADSADHARDFRLRNMIAQAPNAANTADVGSGTAAAVFFT